MQPGANGDSRGPVFVLLGTTRIGDRYSALLRHRDGQHVVVVSESGAKVPIAGYPGFLVTKIDAGSVAIRRPDDFPCVAYPGLGVGCMSPTTAALALRISGPAAAAGSAAAVPFLDARGDPGEVRAAPGSLLETLQAKAVERGEKPEVPTGMELIETPSGYRLVPED